MGIKHEFMRFESHCILFYILHSFPTSLELGLFPGWLCRADHFLGCCVKGWWVNPSLLQSTCERTLEQNTEPQVAADVFIGA